MDIPSEKYSFHNIKDIQMRFNDIDALHHVNNTVYFEYMDLGKSKYIDDVLRTHFDFIKKALVIVNVNCEFYHMAHFGEPIVTETRVDEIGHKSITFEQRVINRDTRDVKCIGRTVMVGFDIEKGVPMEISDDIRADIGAYEGRTFDKLAPHHD